MDKNALRIHITGQEDLAQFARNCIRVNVPGQLERDVKEGSFIAERGIKKRITEGPTRAIDTGLMRASTRVNRFVGGFAPYAVVGPNTKYAVYVHEGTRRMKARPFIEKALEDITPDLTRLGIKGAVQISEELVKGV